MTRDSIVWWFGIGASALTGLVLNIHAFPWIPDPWVHGLSLAAFVVGIISGKMASSPLKHSGESEK